MVYRDKHWLCPRDGAGLEGVHIGVYAFMRCPDCRGAFLQPIVLDAMCAAMGGLRPSTQPIEAARPLRCPSPSCSEPLRREKVPLSLGVAEIDGCVRHGVWFDRGALESVLERVGLDALAAQRR